MLSHLSIKNFALIDFLHVDFHEGLNIITGETGSGKSIIFEAISLALGSRADTTYIRKGCTKSVIQLLMDIEDPSLLDYIRSLDVDIQDDSLLITREIYTTGKSVCKINDAIVTVTLLNKICKRLVDIHGQYDHQSLLNPENHIHLVDSLNAETTEALKTKVRTSYDNYTAIDKKLKHVLANDKEAARRLDFLNYEWQEISGAKLIVNEDVELSQKLNRLIHSEKIYAALNESYELCYASNDSVVSSLNKISSLLSSVAGYDDTLKGYQEIIDNAMYQLEDVSHELRNDKDSMDFSMDEMDTIQGRLDVIDTLKRKYGKDIPAILAYQNQIREEMDALENSEYTLDTLKKDLKVAMEELYKDSLALRNLRKESSLLLEKKLEEELKNLHFNNSSFSIHFEDLPEEQDKISFSEKGMDSIEFLISTNKGEPLKPLSKIASGGEMSRIMLAFKKIINSFDHMPTMIFDEIDAGISGMTASIVGKRLKDISKNHQILCITHLPQIASMGDYHYSIQKETQGEDTLTSMKELDYRETVEALARLLGSTTISDAAIKNAEDLLSQSQ